MAMVEAQVAALELEKVLPKVRKLFERQDKFYATIAKRPATKVSNRSLRIPLEVRPGGKFQYFNPDGGDLGRGGGPTFDKALINCAFVSENIEYTKLVEWATDSDEKAVQNGVRRLVAGALDELRTQLDRQLVQGDGTGSIGTITVVATAAGVDTYTLENIEFGTRLIRFDQVVQVFDATLVTLRGKGTVTKVDEANAQIDVTPAIAGAVATDILVVDGISAPASLPAILGIEYHHSNASTGSWLGMSRVNIPEIRSNRVNGGGTGLTLPLARLAMNRMGARLDNEDMPKPVAWMHPAQMAAYEEIAMLSSTITKSDNGKQSFDMYFGKAQMAGMSVKTHFNWNKTRIDFIVEEVWGRAEILPIGFYKTDGRHIFEIRGASGGVATADIFYMVWGGNFFVNNPQATSYIDNLSVPIGY